MTRRHPRLKLKVKERMGWPLAALAAVGSVASIASLLISGDAVAQEETIPATPTGDIGKAVVADAPEGSTIYTIVSDESSASYTVEEELAGVGGTEAVGTTTAIIGEIVLDPDGNPLAGSRLDIDLRTLTSDETRRDNYLRGNSLESDTYPLATFIVTGVEDWTGALTDDEETEFTLVGNLTVHGVTKEVKWDATATMEDDAITGEATTSFAMADFDIDEPSAPIVLGVDETIKLDLTITATPTD